MNIFKQLVVSLYSPKDIAKFRFQGIGKSILYVFMLTLLSIIPTSAYLSTGIMNGLDAAEEGIQNELPPFQISNGTLQSDLDEPLTVTVGEFTIFFDSTGGIDEGHVQNTNNAIALLQNEFVFVAGSEMTSYPYSMLGDVTFTNEDILEFLSSMGTILTILIPILILVVYIFSAGLKFIEISILALIGLSIKSIIKLNLKYGQIWRMSAYSVTLPTIFFTLMAALKTTVPSGFLINWFVAIIMLFLALKEIPKPKDLT